MRSAIFASLAVICLLASGCIVRSDVGGSLFLDQQGIVAVTDADTKGDKTGEAQAMSILGMVGLGDATLTTAMANGGITKATHVDFKSWQVLGIYGTYTVVVYGK